MGLWDKIQEDVKNNLKEGLEIFKEGSAVFTQKIEEFTEGGKKKYKKFNINMKVQEEFAKLGGEIYDLISAGAKDPLGDKKVLSIINAINELENRIEKSEADQTAAVKKTTAIKKTVAKKKTAVKKKTATKKKTTVTKKTAAKKKPAAKKTTTKKAPVTEQSAAAEQKGRTETS